MTNGAFIVLDGNDGSGKATQAKLLGDRLTSVGTASEKIDFPAYHRNFFGTLIGECLKGEHGDFLHMDPKIASSLYAFDRLESTPYILESIKKGRVVISDRFTSSNQIHQGGKIESEEERKLFLAWLDTMEHDVLSIPRPDAIIYLRVPVETSLELLSKKREAKIGGLEVGQKDTVEEDREYLDRSYSTANWLASCESNWHVVECFIDGALRRPKDISEEVFKIVQLIQAKHT
jgi:dTMP kinase